MGAAAGPRRAAAGGELRASSPLVLALAIAGIVAGAAAWLAGASTAAHLLWGATTLVCLLPLAFTVARELLRGRTGVDLIAVLAMAGALAVGEQLAGAVVAVMLAGGQVLERHATGRARRELTHLLSRAPRVAHRRDGERLVEVPLAAVAQGDRLVVRAGEVLPVDGVVEGDAAVLDESALTGEARPVERRSGERVRSGTLNAGPAFELRATAAAEASTYAGIVRLVAQAESEKAPLVRLADRYAIWFLPFTLAVAALAWAASHDAKRAIAVLVVATPCPLILAAPIAIVAGISRAARAGVIVKAGGALETLARGEVLLLDKTGTVTAGRPRLAEVVTFAAIPAGEALRLAASLDLVSPHALAEALVAAARERGLHLAFPRDTREAAGDGIEGTVEGRRVRVGKADWVMAGGALPPAAAELRAQSRRTGSSAPFVAVDGTLVAALVLEDSVRDEAPATLRALRAGGFREIVLLTGDQAAVAAEVGEAVGVDRVLAEQSPPQKVEAVRAARRRGVTVMVGDGINDAPALAAAEVGVAMGARGASASSEAADVVIVPDRLGLLVDAHAVARRSRRIAVQSIVAGMLLSGAGMMLAAAGWLAPVAGAVAQEAIDLLVILNALRALR
ncbi:MAG TPA: heavy metal translocating P-type ATPase [Thermoanaerobaculia bacterium]|jgi:heavy metal translocating P-type ATPase|nr:heavy metal translocating P-type ATPase [Thermoanaerobaculia bacterium]